MKVIFVTADGIRSQPEDIDDQCVKSHYLYRHIPRFMGRTHVKQETPKSREYMFAVRLDESTCEFRECV